MAQQAERRDAGSEDLARREHHRRLELVVENTTNMVVVTDRNRQIEWVNPAYTKVTGWTLEEVKGRNPRSFLHGPRTNPVDAFRLAGLLRKGLPVKDFELLNYKKSGEPYWVALTIAPVFDERGEVAEYVSIQSDITDRKLRDAEMARLVRTLGEAQRIARLGTAEHDLATGRVDCSEEVARILDASPTELEPTYEKLLTYTHPDDLPLVRRRYEDAINAGAEFESEHRVVSRTGRVKWVHVRGMPEGWDNGTPARCRLTVQDITERKETELLARAKDVLERVSRTQMEVLGRASHELRTPLHALLGFAEMVERLEAARMSERSRERLSLIRQSARHLLLIVNDILDMTRLHDGRMSLDLHAVEVEAMAREVVAMLEPMAAGRGIAVSVEPPDAALFALADRQRLAQMLINLVANAITYNRPAGRVSVRFKPVADRQVAIEVQDSGVGIAAEHLGRLFEPFYRVADRQPEASGEDSSGLGLATARTLARAMGGDIVVQSTLGVGSTFSVTLPGAVDPGPTQARTWWT